MPRGLANLPAHPVVVFLMIRRKMAAAYWVLWFVGASKKI